jgi:hypothetical protein
MSVLLQDSINTFNRANTSEVDGHNESQPETLNIYRYAFHIDEAYSEIDRLEHRVVDIEQHIRKLERRSALIKKRAADIRHELQICQLNSVMPRHRSRLAVMTLLLKTLRRVRLFVLR